MGYNKDRTCVHCITYHFVWCVKYRRKVLSPNIESRLLEVIRMIGDDKGFTVLNCKAYDQDHVDCYIAAPPKISPTQIVKYLKGISGNILLREFPDLRDKLYRGELWNGSYFVETIGSPSKSELDRYTERQTDHQL